MFLGVGWGGVTTFTFLRTPMMLRHGTFTCTCAQLRRYVMLRWRCVTSRRGGVGWGEVITFTYLRTPMMLRHGTFTCTCAQLRTYVMLRWRCVTSRRGGVGWGGVGNNVHVLAHSHDVTPRHVHLHVRTIAQIRHATLKMCHVTQGWGGVGWAITFTYLRTPIMLRHGTFTCTCAHTSCYVEDVSRHAGVGWGGVG